ncbi:MAG: hypothetical protein ACLT1J_14030 [Mediterraneibacter gnavus]
MLVRNGQSGLNSANERVAWKWYFVQWESGAGDVKRIKATVHTYTATCSAIRRAQGLCRSVVDTLPDS